MPTFGGHNIQMKMTCSLRYTGYATDSGEIVVPPVLRAREGVWSEHLLSTTYCSLRVGEHTEET